MSITSDIANLASSLQTSALIPNLNADVLDGLNSTYYTDQSNTALSVGSSASSNTVYLQSVNDVQNTNIINVNTFVQSAYDSANNVGPQITPAFDQANAAFDAANTKTFTFEQNTAPTTANSADNWVQSDTGVFYHNFGNTTNPVWAEVGPTGVATNTAPGLFSATQVSVGYSPATTVNAAIQVTAANTQGGTGYADFLKVTNTSGGSTNVNKWFRVGSTGTFEIINSAYTGSLLSLTDSGVFSTGQVQISGKKAVNGPAFRAYIASNQTITSGSQQKVTFGSENFDTDNCFASSTFTPTVEGYYQLNATVRIAGSSGTGEVMIVLYKNGSEYARGTNEGGTEQGASWFSQQISDIAYANGTTDYFEVYFQQTSGSNHDTTAGSTISHFSGCMIRGA